MTFQFKLSSLFLDPASKEKFLRLIGVERYDIERDMVSITVDRCPYRKQNREYAEYLVKALYYESQNRAEWELAQTEVDKVNYEVSEEEVNELTEKLTKILSDEGENAKTLADYKSAALEHFKLKNEIPLSFSN